MLKNVLIVVSHRRKRDLEFQILKSCNEPPRPKCDASRRGFLSVGALLSPNVGQRVDMFKIAIDWACLNFVVIIYIIKVRGTILVSRQGVKKAFRSQDFF